MSYKKEVGGFFKHYNKMNDLLSGWYGSDRAYREMVNHLPEGSTVAETVDKLMSATMTPQQKKLMDVKTVWAKLVGDQIAVIAKPVRVHNDTLYIEVSHNAWLRELSTDHTKQLIVTNINKYCGEQFCRSITFIPPGGSYER